MSTGAAPPVLPTPAEWEQLVAGVLAHQERLQLVFQPVVSLRDAVVVGYEALARFTGPDGITPDAWFAAADRIGRGAELEAVVVARCLDLRPSLPPRCFLSVNVSPHLLPEPALLDVLTSTPDLRPLILELTEHRSIDDLGAILGVCERLRERGALLALDDAGSGYAGLRQITQLRPQLIKLDRTLVANSQNDEVKLALAEMLGEFASRIDAWLLAEGVETWGELEALRRLGVPLAQGYLLGRPGPGWAQLDPAAVARLRSGTARAQQVGHVAALVDEVPVEPDARPGEVGVRVDRHGAPEALLLPAAAGHRVVPVSLRVVDTTTVVEAARRVVARPEHCRFDPVVCVDADGRVLGIVRVERLLVRLADDHV